MRPIRIFISSVQSEFAHERKMLYDYISTDALLGKFFSVFLFENFPAASRQASSLYLYEVQTCDIYLGIFGQNYGYEDSEGISPTEHEFNCANEHNKTKLIFITNHSEAERAEKENALIKKAEQHVIRKQFTDEFGLKTAVYNALISYLEDKEYIRTLPFDASACVDATYEDLDEEKIRLFAGIAQRKRAFPISADAPIELILTHLNLLRHKHLTNAAILLFGKQPQRFFLSSEIKCAHFHGTTIAKPIPSYQVFKGDLFQLILQATDFVLSKINVSVGVRNKGVEAAIDYEIPIAAVSEAIINAVAHRDYTSNGSVQVMIFQDRVEIWNPGHLPYGLTPAMLKFPHYSIPVNPLIAQPLYLSGTIERMGTGIADILLNCEKANLKEPEFLQDDAFRIILYRTQLTVQPTAQPTVQPTVQATVQAVEQLAEFKHINQDECVNKLLLILTTKLTRDEIQEKLGLKHRGHFISNYLSPAIERRLIQLLYPSTPNHPNQAYLLTPKGKRLLKKLIES